MCCSLSISSSASGAYWENSHSRTERVSSFSSLCSLQSWYFSVTPSPSWEEKVSKQSDSRQFIGLMCNLYPAWPSQWYYSQLSTELNSLESFLWLHLPSWAWDSLLGRMTVGLLWMTLTWHELSHSDTSLISRAGVIWNWTVFYFIFFIFFSVSLQI